jgi:Tryptophan-associated transmembrane protein (Trp_oprn_chp)
MTEPRPAAPVGSAPVGNAPTDDSRVDDDAARRRTARRGLAMAVLACVVGAGLALFAATRTWTTTTERQPPPLPAKLVDHTGASLIGWLPALALVGLAGAGALLAARGRVRRIIGVLLVLIGLGVVAGAIDGLDLAAGTWPVIVGVGGLGIAWAGLSATRSGSTWPAMGARYERPARPGDPTAAHADAAAEASMRDASAPAGSGPRPPTERATTAGPRTRTPASMWDDLDRGVDPTDREA